MIEADLEKQELPFQRTIDDSQRLPLFFQNPKSRARLHQVQR
jgi:hypothetical protein